MDLLNGLLGDKTSELVAGLVDKTGFTTDQAKAFVPEATGSVVDAVKNAGDLDFSNIGAASQTVMGKMDVSALAGKVGIEPQQAQKGLTAFVPQLLQLVSDKAGGAAGVMSLLGGLKQGGLGGMLGGLGKMLGKS